MACLITYLNEGEKVVIKANGKKIAEIKSGIVKKFNQKYFKTEKLRSVRSLEIQVKRSKK